MDDLIAFLRKQIVMDEQTARAMPHAIENLTARWSPARLLADAASKRLILDWCEEVIGDRDLRRYEEFGSLKTEPEALAVMMAVETLKSLTLPYAGKSGYHAEWRPE